MILKVLLRGLFYQIKYLEIKMRANLKIVCALFSLLIGLAQSQGNKGMIKDFLYKFMRYNTANLM
jgi:hypothetical protein